MTERRSRRGIGGGGCRNASRAATWPIAAINLSLGSSRPMDDGERALLEEYVAAAHLEDINVVAAAGNSGGQLDTPANVNGIFPVAAGDTGAGRLCSYASYASDVLIGPACGIAISWQGLPANTDGGGSSSASAYASALIALVRTLRPEATWQQAERWLLAGARRNIAAQPMLNGESTARAAGLGEVVDRALLRMARQVDPAPTVSDPETPSSPLPVAASTDVRAVSDLQPRAIPALGTSAARVPQRLGRPRVSIRWRRGTLRLALARTSRIVDAVRVTLSCTGEGKAPACSPPQTDIYVFV